MSTLNKYNQILIASSRIFLKYGFEKATVEAIAAEAKVGKGTIYEYFESKENLFVEMIKAGVTYVYNDLYKVFNEKESVEETLELFLQSSLQLINEHDDKLSILYADISKMPSDLETWFIEKGEWLINQIARVFQYYMDNNEIRPVCSDMLARLILHSIQTGFYYRVIKEEQDIERILREQLDIIIHGIRLVDEVE